MWTMKKSLDTLYYQIIVFLTTFTSIEVFLEFINLFSIKLSNFICVLIWHRGIFSLFYESIPIALEF